MTSSAKFPDRDSPSAMDPKLYLLSAQANSSAGYRYSVEAQAGSQTIQRKTATIAVVWTNYGSKAAAESWVPGYKLVDFSGAVVRALPATVNLKMLVRDDQSDRSGTCRSRHRQPSRFLSTSRAWRLGTTRCALPWNGNSTSGAPRTW
jgi:hypothetical protein